MHISKRFAGTIVLAGITGSVLWLSTDSALAATAPTHAVVSHTVASTPAPAATPLQDLKVRPSAFVAKTNATPAKPKYNVVITTKCAFPKAGGYSCSGLRSWSNIPKAKVPAITYDTKRNNIGFVARKGTKTHFVSTVANFRCYKASQACAVKYSWYGKYKLPLYRTTADGHKIRFVNLKMKLFVS